MDMANSMFLYHKRHKFLTNFNCPKKKFLVLFIIFHTLFVESALYQNQQNFVAIYNILKTALLKVVKVLLIFYGEKSPQQIS